MKADPDISAISAGELAEELLFESLIDPVIKVMGKDGHESSILEFKGVYSSDEQTDIMRWHVAKAAIAMANADGGCIIIGLDNDGTTPVDWRPALPLKEPEDKDFFEHARNFIFKDAYRDETGAAISVPAAALQRLKQENTVKFHICKSEKIPGSEFLVLVVNPVDDVIVCKVKRTRQIKGGGGENIVEKTTDSLFCYRSSESAHVKTLSSREDEFIDKYTEYNQSRIPAKPAYFSLLQEFRGEGNPAENDLSFLDELLESNVEISYHAFIETGPSDEDKTNYVSAFALVFAAIGGFTDVPYWASLTRFFHREELTETVKRLTDTPKQINISAIRKTLSSDERRYAWCLDAMMLGSEDGKVNDKVALVVEKFGKVFGYRVNELRPFLEQVAQLIAATDPQVLFEAIRAIRRRTSAWKTIMDYRRLSLKGAFKDTLKRLKETSNVGTELYYEIITTGLNLSSMALNISILDIDAMTKSLDSMAESDPESDNPSPSQDKDQFTPERRAETLKLRGEELAKFKDIKQRVSNFLECASSMANEANDILAAFGTNGINFYDDTYQIEPDETIGAGNERWEDNMQSAYDKLNKNVERANTAIEDLLAQISLYEKGKYEESVVKKKKEAEEARRQKLTLEEEARKKARVDIAGTPYEITLDTRKIEHPPFYAEDVQALAFFAGHWIAVADGKFWCSENAFSWHERATPVEIKYGEKLKIVGSTLILWDEGSPEFCFTTDRTTWTKSRFPDVDQGWNVDIFHIHGRWLLLRKHWDDYSYLEIGEMEDKKKSASADTTYFFEAQTLTSGWTARDDLKMYTGNYVLDHTLFSAGDTLSAIRAEDSLMLTNQHRTDNGPRLVFARKGKGWSTVYADDVNETLGYTPQIFQTPRGIFCVGNGICTTTDGISWQVVAKENAPKQILVIGDLVVGVNWNTLSLSTDARSFVELNVGLNIDSIATNGETVLFADKGQQAGGLFLGKLVRVPLCQ